MSTLKAISPLRKPPPVCSRCPYGRHGARERCGRFRSHRAPRYCVHATLRDEYLCYLDAAYDAAEQATRGHMLTAHGRAIGMTGGSFYRAARPARSDRYASPELRDHWRDHGKPLTFTAWVELVSEVAA